jgi:hypothetical protein
MSAAVAASLGPLLQEAAGRPRGTLGITSEPSAAEIYIAGEKLGVTPYRAGRLVGSYEVELRKPGYEPYKAALRIDAGQTQSIAATLSEVREAEPPPAATPAPGTALPSARRPLWRIATGVALIGGGGLLAGFGVSALAIDGLCELGRPSGPCPARYDTLVPGVALVSAGALLIIGGVTLAAVPARRRPSAPLSYLLLGGAGAPLRTGLRF